MKKPNILLITLLVLLLVAGGIYIGRKTAPSGNSAQARIDTLNAQVKRANERAILKDQEAKEAFEKGVESQKAKVIHHTVFRRDTAANHRMRKYLKDSLIRALFAPDPSMDSSMFSDPVANGVLDLESENKMLKADDMSDSTTILRITEAYYAKDSALQACGEARKGEVELVTIANNNEARARKQAKRLRIAACAGVGGTIGGATAGPVGAIIGAVAGTGVGILIPKK